MTTHYEKIQALGNRMASNLETMGVSASFSDGGLTLADKILQIQYFTDGLLLWADKDIIQTGDTVNVYALLLDERKAVSGETILFNGLETTQTLVANTETSVGNQYKFINLPTMTDFSQRVYLNEEQTIHITKGQQDTNYYIWIPGTPSGYFVPIDNDSDIIVENGVIKLKSNHSDWTYDASATNTNKITSTISDVTIAETMQGTTGSNGVATVSYTGKGAGVLNIKAVHGIIQSETFELLDCIKYDKAVTENHNDIWNINGGILARGAEYSSFEEETIGTTGSMYATISNEGTIEFEYYQTDGASNTTSIAFASSSNNNRCYINISNVGGSVGEWISIKIEYTSTQAVFTNLNTEQSYTKAVSDTDVSRFKLGTYNDITSFRFRNVRIY